MQNFLYFPINRSGYRCTTLSKKNWFRSSRNWFGNPAWNTRAMGRSLLTLRGYLDGGWGGGVVTGKIVFVTPNLKVLSAHSTFGGVPRLIRSGGGPARFFGKFYEKSIKPYRAASGFLGWLSPIKVTYWHNNSGRWQTEIGEITEDDLLGTGQFRLTTSRN